MEFKEILNEYMYELQCSAKALSEASGLSEATISRYRSGERIPEAGSDNLAAMIKGLAAIAADCSAAAESDAASGRIRTPNLGETAGGLTADVSAEAITARFTEAAGFDAFDMDKFRVNLNVLCSTLSMFDNRMEIENPGGLYGRGTIDKLGETGLDTRNPYIAGALELLIGSENRYSGIPTMRFEMKSHSLPDPVFESSQGVFRVTLYNDEASAGESLKLTDQILSYCASPRSREELAERFDFSAPTYFISKYVRPLVREGRLGMTIPDKPKSKNQHYFAK